MNCLYNDDGAAIRFAFSARKISSSRFSAINRYAILLSGKGHIDLLSGWLTLIT